MRIIDTRPFAERRSESISNVPLYDVKALDHIINLENYRNIIFQSAHAVKNFGRLKELNKKRILAIGPATSKELKKSGYIAEQPKEEFNSKGVISHLIKTGVEGNTLVVKGKGGLSEISDYLNSASFKTDEVDCYVREPYASYDQLKKDFTNCDAVIFTSVLSVEIFFQHIFQRKKKIVFLPISSRIKHAIESYGHNATVINYFSKNLDEEINSILL